MSTNIATINIRRTLAAYLDFEKRLYNTKPSQDDEHIRLNLKSIIANYLNTDILRRQWLIDYAFQNIPETPSLLPHHKNKTECPLFKAIVNTHTLYEILDEMKVELYDFFRLGFTNGSMAYASFYNIKDASDLDLTLICDEFPDPDKITIFKDVPHINDIQKFFNTRLPQEICFKLYIRTKEITFHVTPTVWYDKLSNLDFSSKPSTVELYRTTIRNLSFEERFTFDEEEFIWTATSEMIGLFQKLTVSDFELSNSGKYINGVLTDKYLISKHWFGDKNYYTRNKALLSERLKERCEFEKKSGLISPDSHIYFAMARHKYFPNYFFEN